MAAAQLFETPPPQDHQETGLLDLPDPHPVLDYLLHYSQVLNNTAAMPAVEEAWGEFGLRYDAGLQTVVIKPEPEAHAMTLRSHRLTCDLKCDLDKYLPVCDAFEFMIKLRDNVTTDVCFIKKNGTLRRMRCSLKDHIGNQSISIHQPDQNQFTAVCGDQQVVLMKNNLLRVWDLEKLAWRSLYIDSIVTVDRCFFIASVLI